MSVGGCFCAWIKPACRKDRTWEPTMDPQLSLEIDERTRLQTVWSQALRLAEGKLGREAVESWLRDTVPLSLAEGTLVLNAPNATARTWIEKKYATALI